MAAINSFEDIWNTLLGKLENKYSQTAMDTWFKTCRPIDMSNDCFIVAVDSSFQQKILKERFNDFVEEQLSDIFSVPMTVKYILEDEVEEYLDSRESDNSILPAMDGYTFSNYIVGNSNKIAHAAAIAVSKNPGGKANNPLYIYGNSGLGKTHLLLAIGSAVHESKPNAKIEYIKGDDFLTAMVKSIQTNTTEEFRHKFRELNLLLVDDIHFIVGKERTQEEFFHTFNQIYESGGQIVITCDRPPRDMPTLEDRLKTRFEWGIIQEITKPDYETRTAILKNKASQLGMQIPDWAVDKISTKVTDNIRKIEGVVKKLSAYVSLNNEITPENVDLAMADVIRNGGYTPNPELIIDETVKYYGITKEEIFSANRAKNIKTPRQVAIHLIRALTDSTLEEIGKLFNRSHSTINSALDAFQKRLSEETELRNCVRDITSNINSRQ